MLEGFRITKDQIQSDAELEQEVHEIFDQMDIDQDAEINITEWIANAIDKKSLIKQENLEIAFNWFD